MTTLIAKFENVKTRVEFDNLVAEFIETLKNTDSALFELGKKWVGYGTWKSGVFVNKYHFLEMTGILEKACSGVITHDEEKEFTVDDFEVEITEELYLKYF